MNRDNPVLDQYLPGAMAGGVTVFCTARTELDSAMRRTLVFERVARHEGALLKTVIKTGPGARAADPRAQAQYPGEPPVLLYHNPLTLPASQDTLHEEDLIEFFRNKQRIVDDIARNRARAAALPEAPWQVAVRANRARVQRIFEGLQAAPAAPACVVDRSSHPATRPILHVLPRLLASQPGGDSVLAMVRASLPRLGAMGFSTLMLGCVDRQTCELHIGEDECGQLHTYANNHGYWSSGEPGIDPALGTQDDYLALAQAARAQGVMLMQDTVLASMGYPPQLARLAPSSDGAAALGDPLRCLKLGGREAPVCDPDCFLHEDCMPEEDSLVDPVPAQLYADVVAQGHCGSLYALPKPNLFNPEVLDALLERVRWQIRAAGVNAFRIDMAKHIGVDQLCAIIAALRTACGGDGAAMTVLLEYWTTRYRDLKFAMLATSSQARGVYFYDFPLAQALQDILLRDHDVGETLAGLVAERARWGIAPYQLIPTFIDHDFSFRPIYNGDEASRAMVVVGYALAAMLSANAPYVYFAFDKSDCAMDVDAHFARTPVAEVLASGDEGSPADAVAALLRAVAREPALSHACPGSMRVEGDVYSATITRTMPGVPGAVQAHFSRFYEPEPDADDPSVIYAYCHGPSIVIRRIDAAPTEPALNTEP